MPTTAPAPPPTPSTRSSAAPAARGGRLAARPFAWLALLLALAWPARGAHVDAQVQQLEALRDASDAPLEVVFQQGVPAAVGLSVPVAGSNPVDRARRFLATYPHLFRTSPPITQDSEDPTLPRDLMVAEVEAVEGNDVVRFRQTIDGIPVFAGELVVAMAPDMADGVRVIGIAGSLLPPIELEVAVGITEAQAADFARADLGRPGAPIRGEVVLMVFDPRVFGQPAAPRLVWAVTVAGGDPWQVLIDAVDGETAFRHPLFADGAGTTDYDLYFQDANGGTIQNTNCFNPTTLDDYIGSKNGIIQAYMNDPQATAMWWHLIDTYLYFHGSHGRHSWDDDDGEVEAYVHSGLVNNAQYVPGCGMEYGENVISYDVTVHEFTHGVVDFTSNLIYCNEPGGLNESFADVFGALADSQDWLIGEDLMTGGGPIRSLADPRFDQCRPLAGGAWGNCGSPDKKSLQSPLAGMCSTGNDFGNVHSNSGITNKAAFLVAQGGSFNGFTLTGMGRPKMGKLWYHLMHALPSGASLAQFRSLAWSVAGAWGQIGTHGYTPADACRVRNALAAVELGGPDLDCNGVDDSTEDPDGDFIVSSEDNCPAVSNPAQQDSDADGVGDACDPDSDGDGCPNAKDTCEGLYTPCTGVWLGPLDTDGDGQGNPCDPDDDNDGVLDGSDNCQWNHNPDQFDGNNDGVGDACDPDLDGDGLYGLDDNCTFVANADQADADGDGMGDACDKCPNVSDNAHAYTTTPLFGGDPVPLQPDSDDDGIPDACDNFAFGQVGLKIDGAAFNPTRGLEPNGDRRAVLLQGPAGGGARLPLPICPASDGEALLAMDRHELVFEGLAETVEMWVEDERGSRVTQLSPTVETASGPRRGLRLRPDCRRLHFLATELGPSFSGEETGVLTLSPVMAPGANPWTLTRTSADDSPPEPAADSDGDGRPDTVDACPEIADPEVTCLFADGLETGTTSRWSGAVGAAAITWP